MTSRDGFFSTAEVRALTGAGPGQLQRWIRQGAIPGMEQRRKGEPHPRRRFTAKQVEVVRRLVEERAKAHQLAVERRIRRVGRVRAIDTPQAGVRELKTATSDAEANELLRQGWDLYSVATTGLAVHFVLVKRRRRATEMTPE
jgi:hypothetical protein